MSSEFLQLSFKYIMVLLYVGLTFALAYWGMKKTKDLKGFSIGNKDMSPVLIGLTMAASIASTATFVINPGFVYVHGLSAYLHYGVAAPLGTLVAFLCLTKGFRQIGEVKGALTIPDWIFHRYGSRGFALFFAGINLLSITFVVLILVGCSLLMTALFPISQQVGLIIVLLFVFSYILMGGTYAHAYTNSFQAVMMLGIALFLFFHGVGKYSPEGIGESINYLSSISPSFMSMFNPESNLYYDFFSVFASGFIITFALMLQPHILSKILYIKNDKDVSKFLWTTIAVGFCFGLILFTGFFAQLAGLDLANQDAVVSVYVATEFSTGTFGPYILIFITLTMLAAGMSSLDGILVSLSAMVVNDIYLPYKGNDLQAHRRALMLSRFVLVGLGLLAFALAWNPPALVGLFAQKGVYGLAAALLVPILIGVLYKGDIPLYIPVTGALVGVFGHFFLHLGFGVDNPAVSASVAILLSLGISGVMLQLVRIKQRLIIPTSEH